jgi:hypothetical protein
MANRRMFSKEVIRTDRFLEMPQTAQCLYFHLGLEADDDGFISPKMVMRTLGSNEDDLKVLIGKGFIIPFESGVVVVRHWKTHNYIQSDRYKRTLYQEEFGIACEDNVYKMDTQIRLDKDRLGKIRKEERSSFKKNPTYKGLEMRFSKNKWWVLPKDGGDWLEFAGRESEIEYL